MYFLLAAATVAASAAAERNKNRNNVAATRAATLETVAAAKKQQKNYPKAIAAAGHSAFVEIVHVRSSHIVTGLFLIPLLHNTQIAAKTLHQLTKSDKILIIYMLI